MLYHNTLNTYNIFCHLNNDKLPLLLILLVIPQFFHLTFLFLFGARKLFFLGELSLVVVAL